MSLRTIGPLLLLISFFGTPYCVQAQTDSTLLAPSHTAGFLIATAETDEQKNIKILLSQKTVVAIGMDEELKPGDQSIETEEVEVGNDGMYHEQYTISVPYAERVMVKDQMVTISKMRQETRTRSLKIDPEQQKVLTFQSEQVFFHTTGSGYTPFFNYSTVTQFRPVQKDQRLVHRKNVVPGEFKMDQLKFFSIDGTLLNSETAEERFFERAPIVLINSPEGKIDSFYHALLSDNVTLVYVAPEDWKKALSPEED